MVTINASLFAHIQNDANLSGTYKLEGNHFSNTVLYLKEYLESLKVKGGKEEFPLAYQQLFKDTKSLLETEQALDRIALGSQIPQEIDKLGGDIAKKLQSLPVGQKLLMPGGWSNRSGGHGMVYQFVRTKDGGYEFTIFNAGGGINYHHKGSGETKELYNPTKTWKIPPMGTGEDEANEAEVGLFISRLLKARIHTDDRKKPINEKILYEEILPTISHIKGVEQEPHAVPEHAYTGGQLSGTCSQRCLHQMLKINSPSVDEYEQFIFKFKHHALRDYIDACINQKGGEKLTRASLKQINLAIENNLKILKTEGLFDEFDTENYLKELLALQEQVNEAPLVTTKKSAPAKHISTQLRIDSNVAPTATGNYSNFRYDANLPKPVNFGQGKNFLTNIKQAVRDIKNIKDPATQYYYLEQLILALPIQTTGTPLYQELTTLGDYEEFGKCMDDVQNLLNGPSGLRKNWLNKAQTGAFNIMELSALALQINIQDTIARTKNLPVFTPFANTVMQTIIGNNQRNPFWATNHPGFDQKFQELQNRYNGSPTQTHQEFFDYLNGLLKTEPQLKADLESIYLSDYKSETSSLHQEIRSRNLQALYVLSVSPPIKGWKSLDPKFKPIIDKIQAHLKFESTMRRVITPHFDLDLSDSQRLDLDKDKHGSFLIYSPLYASFITWQKLATRLSKHRYVVEDSSVLDALNKDTTDQTPYQNKVKARTANDIQLHPSKKESDALSSRHITQQDITTRDYFHLRSEPKLQITLTLDYFTRNIAKLSKESDKRYVEANLFQPGLLSEAFKNPTFFPQFDKFLKTGFRFFNKNGQCTRDSLVFFRLDYLVSRYLYLSDKPAGLKRLQNVQEALSKQLALPNGPDETYVLQQYLFLTVMTQIEMGEKVSSELFATAFNAYFYLQGHADPLILQDLNHRIEVDAAIAKFQALASQQPEHEITNAVQKTLAAHSPTLMLEKGRFPIYELKDTKDKKTLEFNVFLGKIFENGLAHGGLPLALQNHALIKHLNLQEQRECLISADEKYMVLPNPNHEVRLFYGDRYGDKKLTVQKDWTIDGKKHGYELQALTKNHLAYHANEENIPVTSSLPLALTDGTSDYWYATNNSGEGLLVQNNSPVYSIDSKGIITVLDKEGKKTPYQLSQLDKRWHSVIHNFESNNFILAHTSASHTLIKLPRYNLTLEVDTAGTEPALVYPETGERIVEGSSPIHPNVGGLVLSKGDYSRCLVPVARFYATEDDAEQSDFYPVVHDTNGTIAKAELKAAWERQPPAQEPMWQYQGSEKYVSFRLQDGEPVADTVADALYLAYTYLATDQTEKAWAVLEDCNTRLGGLTGDPAELQFLSWICKDMPHILPNSNIDAEDATKSTPPYVACQLKALGLASDFLMQDRKFDLKAPSLEDSANAHYALNQHQGLEKFLKALPGTIYQTFDRYQSMGRHLEHGYQLSNHERKSLLDYYHMSQPKPDRAPRGSLGYEWMNLTIEAIQQERDALLAREKAKTSTPADKKRLEFIDKQLKKLQNVSKKSTKLEEVSIDLSISSSSFIREAHLLPGTVKALESWQDDVFDSKLGTIELTKAVAELSSSMTDDTFITNFPAYLQLARSNKDPELQKRLLTFCKQTLLASRHVPFYNQESNIPLLCNILYRVVSMPGHHYSWGAVKFSQLVSIVSGFEVGENTIGESPKVPPIKVLQAKDIYTKVLATPEQILARKRPEHIPLVATKLEKTSLLEQKDIHQYLEEKRSGGLVEELEKIITHYRKLQEKSIIGHESEIDTENAAGKHIFALEQEQKKLAKSLIENPKLGELVRDMTEKVTPALKNQAQKSWEEALKLADEGPADPKEARKWKIEQHAKARPTLKKKDLIAMYCRADVAYSMEKTGLSAEKVKQLHDLIHKALFQDIQHQAVKNINSNLDKALKTKDETLAFQALDALARENIPGLEEPATVIIQHEEDILLRTRQVSALKSLLEHTEDGRGFKERIEKVIPGGGKSKVILPVAAEKKAEGDNLVVIEVPPALLETNYIDFNRTSQRLFGKGAYRFTFNRDSNSSPERLKQIYQEFTEVMTNRRYMVTTGDSIQSLELKYVELLLSKERDKNWEKQVYWLDKITNLLHHHADCLIDEVHQGLWLKKKLNYTSGEPIPLDPTIIKNSTALYGFIDPQFIKDAPNFDINYDWTPFKKELATKLVKESNSPLQQFVSKAAVSYKRNVDKELIDYIMGVSDTISEVVANATPQEKELLAFLKQQVSTLLPETLHQKVNVRYGATKEAGLSPVEYTLAIPYGGNDNPNEGSRFGNELEAINYTIQMMLIKGISEELFKQRIAEWQAVARQELFQNPMFKNIDDTSVAKGFALLEENSGIAKEQRLTLSKVNIDDPVQMAALYKRHQYNRTLAFSLLQERSLKQIHHDGAIIHSDSFNHIDIYRSSQGVSGTPGNHTTFHQRLHFDVKSSLGSDGYIIEVLRNKNTQVSSLEYTNAAQFIETALTNSKSPNLVRAIVDVNATFTGVTNFQVAKEIALFINKKPTNHFTKPIKHVLYFNDAQILCALDVNKLDAEPMVLGTSDEKEISRLLGSTPEERFTYYDQIHTLGTDIKQFDTAHAIVLADEKDSFQAVVQGNLRMRGLAQKQTLEFIVPKRLEGITLDGLIDRLVENDKKTLWLDNLFATKAQMTNLLRRTALTAIQDLPPKEAVRKADLAKKFEQFFVEVPTLELFALYGAINKAQATTDLLANYKEQLLRQWANCYELGGLTPDEKELQQLRTTMETIIKTALPHCLEKYEGLDDSLAKEVQVQKQVQKQVQVERISLNACYDPKLDEAYPKSWAYLSMSDFFKKEGIDDLNEMTMPLNQFSESDKVLPNMFSDNLRVSTNYAITHRHQKQHINVYLKPVFLVWYHMENDQLHATVVTPQEEQELAKRIRFLPNSWISTTSDTVTAGTRPGKILNDPRYQALREQVRFFNGEFTTLLNQETPLHWLKDKPVEKLTYFENTLQVYRPGSETELPQLKAALTQGNIEGFIYITKHPFEDHSKLNWNELFPKTIPVQAAEYQKVAEAFVYVNNNWASQELTSQEIQEKFGLSFSSLTYVDTHLKHLKGVKDLLQHIQHIADKPFLQDLSEEEDACVGVCLGGIPLPKFLASYGLNNTVKQEGEKSKWQLASVEALHVMRKYPALQDKTVIMDTFEAMVAHASDADVLLALLKAENPSNKLLENVLKHKLSDAPEIVEVFLGLTNKLSEDILVSLAKKCKSTPSIEKLLHKDVTANVVREVLEKKLDGKIVEMILGRTDEFPEDVVLSLAKQCESTPAIETLLQRKDITTYPLIAEKVQKIVVSKDLDATAVGALLDLPRPPVRFSQGPLLSLAEKCGTDTFLIEKLLKRVEITRDALKEVVKKEIDDQAVEAILGLKQTLPSEVMLSIAKKCKTTPLIEKLLTRKEEELTEVVFNEVLSKELDTKAVEAFLGISFPLPESILISIAKQCGTTPLIEKLLKRTDLTENVFNELLNKKLDTKAVEAFLGITSLFPASILISIAEKCDSTPLIEKLLKRKEVTKNQTLTEKILQEVLKKELDGPAIELILGLTSKLTQNTLISLAKRCPSNELVKKLLLRNDITEDVLKEVLNKDKLDQANLLLCIEQAQYSDMLELIYNRGIKDPTVRKTVYQHPSLSPESLLSFLTQELGKDELLLILQHPYSINEKVLAAVMGQKETDSSVLKQIVLLPHDDFDLRGSAIDHTAFSSEVAEAIIENATLTKNHNLLIRLTDKIFAQYKTEKTDEWERILTQMFKKYKYAPTLKASDIKERIKQNKEALSPALGINILRVFGEELIKYLPLEGIITSADSETLKLLVNPKNTGNLSKELLLSLADRCYANGLMNEFLQRNDLTDSVLTAMIDNYKLEERQILEIVKKVKSSETLPFIHDHKVANHEVRKAIYQHNALSSKYVLQLLTGNQLDKDLLLLLKHPTAVNEEVLAAIANKKVNAQVLEKVVIHPEITLDVMKLAIDNSGFSGDVAQQIISQIDTETGHEVLKKLTRKAFAEREISKTPDEWEHYLVQIFGKYASNNDLFSAEIQGIIKEYKPITTKLGLHILDIFGKDMIGALSLTKIIEIADVYDLTEILLNPDKTGPLAEEHLIAIAKKLSDMPKNTTEKLLQRDDITDKVLQVVLAQLNLDQDQLLHILKLAQSSKTLELVFHHRQATGNNFVRGAIYTHASLSSELVLSLISKKPVSVSNDELLQILKHPTAINEDVLKAVAKGNFDSRVLLATVSHPKATAEVMSNAIENKAFSTDIALKIIEINNVHNNHQLLQQLARKAFGEHRRQDAWENCILEVFKKYPSGETKTNDIKDIIKEYEVTPTIGLHILNLYGKDMQGFLPISDMVGIADEAELKLLIDASKTDRHSEANLVALAKKCNTDELIGKLLARNDLTQPVLEVLLDKPLSYEHLHKVLTHESLTEAARENWFENVQAKHTKLKGQAAQLNSREAKLSAALEELRVKAYSHAILALKDDKYKNVAETAVNLYKGLRENHVKYMKGELTEERFQQNCKQAIRDAKPVLDQHRGYKQVLVDILNVILALPSLIGTGNWRLFKAKTESTKIVDKIIENIDENAAKANPK